MKRKLAIAAMIGVMSLAAVNAGTVCETVRAESTSEDLMEFHNVVLVDNDVVKLELVNFYAEDVNWAGKDAQNEKYITIKATNKTDHKIALNPGKFYLNDEECYVSMSKGTIMPDPGRAGTYSFMVARDTTPDHTALESLEELKGLEGKFSGYEDNNGSSSSLEVEFSVPDALASYDGSAEAAEEGAAEETAVSAAAKAVTGDLYEFSDVVLVDNEQVTLELENFYAEDVNWAGKEPQNEKYITVKATNKTDHKIALNPGKFYLDGEECYVSMSKGTIMPDPGRSGSYTFMVARNTVPDHTALDSIGELVGLEGKFSGYEEINGSSSSMEVEFSVPSALEAAGLFAEEAAETAEAAETSGAEAEAAETAEEAVEEAEYADIPADERKVVSFSSYNTLDVGSRGDDVQKLQETLVAGGFLSGGADGIFGNGTAEGVKKFQESAGLEATGIADADTQKKLYNDESGDEDVQVTFNGTSETDHMRLDGVFLDTTLENENQPGLSMVVLCYTAFTNDKNLKLSSVGGKLTFESGNSYTVVHTPYSTEYMPNYYSGKYIKDVYMGSEMKIAEVYYIPKAEFNAGKITYSNSNIPDSEQITFRTGDVIFCKDAQTIAQIVDPEGYAEELNKRAPADSDTTAKVKAEIDGYYWWWSIDSLKYEIEFFSNNTYELRASINGMNQSSTGTYQVLNGYVAAVNDLTTRYIPWEYKDGEFVLDPSTAYDVNL